MDEAERKCQYVMNADCLAKCRPRLLFGSLLEGQGEKGC